MIHHLAILSREARTEWLRTNNALERLRRLGHSASKAPTIVRLAERGNRYALGWVVAAIETQH